MKTINVRVGWTQDRSTYMDVEVDEEEFDGVITEEMKKAAIANTFQQAEEWIEGEKYDYVVKVE
jgi:predicted AlkP superfamily phosphohydrolase/phosphomutase